MRPPTPRQTRVLDFIRGFLEESGFPPTHAEIARGLDFRSPNAASEHVRLLAKKGWLTVETGVARGIRLVSSPIESDAVSLPLIGQVAAGCPILAEAHLEGRIAIAPSTFRPHADYLLRVRGDSMIEDGIRPGDLVAVHRTREVEEGRVAVVRLDDEVTVKRWRRNGQLIVLEPANATLSPITIDPASTHVEIEGQVVGLLRLGDAS